MPTLVTGPLDVTEDDVETSTVVVEAVVVEVVAGVVVVVTCAEPEATYHKLWESTVNGHQYRYVYLNKTM